MPMFTGTTARSLSPPIRRTRSASAADAEANSPDSGVHVDPPAVETAYDSDEDETKSQDTTYTFSGNFQQQQFLGDDCCRVILATKTPDNRRLVCTNPKGSCSRRKHNVLCLDTERTAPTGYYECIPNSKSGADAILETRMSEKEKADERRAKGEDDRKMAAKLLSKEGSPEAELTKVKQELPQAVFDSVPPSQYEGAKQATLKKPPTYASPPATKPKDESKGSSPSDSVVTKGDLELLLNAQNQAALKLQAEWMAKSQEQQVMLMDKMFKEFMRYSEAVQSMATDKDLPAPKFHAIHHKDITAVVKGGPEKLQEMLATHPGAVHDTFDTEKEAQQWLAGMSAGRSPEALTTHIEDGTSTKVTAQKNPQANNFATPTLGSLMHLQGNGTDKSTGKPNEIFGVSLNDSRITETFSPVGISPAGASECMQTMPDVVSLPGKSGVTSDPTSVGLESLGHSILEYLPVGTKPINIRDTQWRSNKRNTLSSIKSTEELTETIDEFHDVRDLVESNFKRGLCSTLSHYGYTTEQAEMYFELGAIPSIVRSSLRFYESLLYKLRNQALKCQDGWEQWKVYLDFHAKKLLLIRLHGQTRTDVLLQNYCYLRDANKNGFMSEKLQAKINDAVYSQTLALKLTYELPESSGTPSKPTVSYTCSHCHSNLHLGGKAKCLFKDKTVAVARAWAKDADQQLKGNPDKSLKEIIEGMK